MWIVRLLGCAMVIISFGLFGRKKAASLCVRVKSIERFMIFITNTAEQIRLSEDEVPEILLRTLPKGVICEGENVIFPESFCLAEADKKIVREFVAELGMGEASSQYRRCNLYKQLLEEKRQEALCEVNEKNRLFNMGGWMAGIALSFLWW